MHEEDVFDSVTWESASAPYDVDPRAHPTGPGFKQSTAGIEEPRGPHDPKWEGYLITMVKDPVKELAETKDAYVSYLVTAKVRDVPHPCAFRTHPGQRRIFLYSLPPTRHPVDGSQISSSCGIT
jgi:sorting nexin-4